MCPPMRNTRYACSPESASGRHRNVDYIRHDNNTPDVPNKHVQAFQAVGGLLVVW
jgi:hypothetical protein